MTLKHTLEIREIMRTYGANTIYTNKHKACRSIKCYQGEISNMSALLRALNKYNADNNLLGVRQINHKRKNTMRYYWCAPNSITVRIPLE